MKIKKYLDELQELPHKTQEGQTIADVMAEAVDVWSNNACKGYALEAMKAAGLSEEQRAAVLHQMEIAFDELSVDAAEQKYLHQ